MCINITKMYKTLQKLSTEGELNVCVLPDNAGQIEYGDWRSAAFQTSVLTLEMLLGLE
jgi:hypothetical protein